jgi:hypothetical protein
VDVDIKARLDSLIQRGTQLNARIPRDQYGPQYWIREEDLVEFQAWLSSAANVILAVAPSSSPLAQQVVSLLAHPDLKGGISSHLVLQLHGILTAAREEFEHGMLARIEYIVAAATFDDFLDHAADYHKGNKKIEASVLASAVLEDTVKKIAAKSGIAVAGVSLEPLIDELAKAGIFTLVKANRVKGFAAVRNHALHAEWDKFDIRDVGELISGTRELLASFL